MFRRARFTRFPFALILMAAAVLLRTASSQTPGTADTFGPVPFTVQISELSLSFKDGLIFRDIFDQAGRFGPTEFRGTRTVAQSYLVSMGSVDGSNVEGGVLTITERSTINPYGPYAAKIILPVDTQGRVTFAGQEAFGDFDLSVSMERPRIPASARFSIGIGDMETLGIEGAVSVSGDSVLLERSGRTIWDHLVIERQPAPDLPEADEVALRLHVNGQAHFSASALIKTHGGRREVVLDPPDPRATIRSTGATLSANVFVETPPKPQIFSVFPRDLTKEKLREKSGVFMLKIAGVGFCCDTEVELFDDRGLVARADDVRPLAGNIGVIASIRLPEGAGRGFSLRVKTAGQTVTIPNALRVY